MFVPQDIAIASKTQTPGRVCVSRLITCTAADLDVVVEVDRHSSLEGGRLEGVGGAACHHRLVGTGHQVDSEGLVGSDRWSRQSARCQ